MDDIPSALNEYLPHSDQSVLHVARCHRGTSCLPYDNDAIFSPAVTSAIKSFGVDPKRIAFRSPWQNGTAERVVGSVRRELLDHVIVLNEDHLRRLLRIYVDYYNAERVHTSIIDSPVGRPAESRPSPGAKVIGLPRVGGLHHRYTWREAA
jgi:transposase InsO family protein